MPTAICLSGASYFSLLLLLRGAKQVPLLFRPSAVYCYLYTSARCDSVMEVAFYHDDPSSRLSGAYDPQSSPGSVESINSTDAGPVSAIATVPPAYRHYSEHDFNKTAALKGMSLSLNGEGIDYGRQQQQQQHLGALPNGSVITTNPCTAPGSGYHHTGVITNSYAALSDATANSLSVNIPEVSGGLSGAISTPEVLNMLKATSPDFERPLSQSSQVESSNNYYRNVTQEQEMYAQGFVRELERLKSQSGSNPNIAASAMTHSPSGASHCSVITSGIQQQQQQQQHQQMYGSPDPYYAEQQQQHENPSTSGLASSQTIHHMGAAVIPHPSSRLQHGSVISHMKEEPSQIVPVISKSPPMSPIDLEHQERIKTERKRMRNRVAASKCRKRKLERISRLEDKVNSLKTQNLELSTNANLLRQQVAELKSKVMAHVNSGCQLMMSQQQVTF